MQEEIKYWLRLYPEMKNIDELNEYLTKIFGCGLKEKLKREQFASKEVRKYKKKLNTFLDEDMKRKIKFAKFCEPVMAEYIDKLVDYLDENKIVEDKKIFVKSIILQSMVSISDIAYRVIVSEIKYAKQNNILKGKTSEQRYNYFVDILLDDEEYRNGIYNKYPFLVHVLDEKMQQLIDFVLEILENTRLHLNEIEKSVKEGVRLGLIKELDLGQGDLHCKGKSVSKLIFSNGVIYYKARNCRVDLQFQKILKYMNQEQIFQNGMKYRPLRMFVTDTCGWMEEVDYKHAKSYNEIEEYYIKLGGLLAILYSLNATDFHQENIIASGKNPMLVDLETLLNVEFTDDEFDPESAFGNVNRLLHQSVQAVGILPSKLHAGNNKGEFEIGGTVNKDRQKSPIKSPIVVNDNTDEISIKLGYAYMSCNRNVPIYKDKEILAEDCIEEIIFGFRKQYEWILNHKREYSTMIIKDFEGVSVRIIVKPTFMYAYISSIAKHPNFFVSEVQNELLNARIGLYTKDSSLTKAEIRAMKRYEIPYFYSIFGENFLRDDMGKKLNIKLYRSSKELFQEKMECLSKEDEELQMEIIRVAFFTQTPQSLHTNIKYSENETPVKKQEKEEYLVTAKKIADYLLRTSVNGVNGNGAVDVMWFESSPDRLDVDDWTYSVASFDLYNGTSGIGLFLLNMWKATGEIKYLNKSRETLEPIIRFIKNGTYNYTELLGAYNGIGSYLYFLSKFVISTGDNTLLPILKYGIDLLDDKIRTGKECDLVAGTIGLLAVMLNILEEHKEEELTEKAKKMAYKLFYSFYDDVKEENRIITYSGFAHGIAGCIPYLYKLYLYEQNQDVYGLFQRLLAYERKMFLEKENKNWKIKTNEINYGKAWCHGAPGILLEKTMLLNMGYKDKLLIDEIKWGIAQTIETGIGNNIVYCHGDIGNLEILYFAAQTLKDESMCAKCQNTYHDLYIQHIQQGWNDIRKSYSKCKGIMLGVSGIGFSLLRMSIRENIDNFLWIG